jgi:hypothetical protein
MFLQSLGCFVGRKSSYPVHKCYSWLLLVWIIGFGPMSLHWLQGMPFWASWLCYVIRRIDSPGSPGRDSCVGSAAPAAAAGAGGQECLH